MAQTTRRKPRLSRIAGWVALTVLLLIPVLSVSAASAAAQQNTCEGQVIQGSCVVDLGPPTCIAPAVFDGVETCVTELDPEVVPSCPDGALGEPGACYVLVTKEPSGEPTCIEGDLVGDNCIIVGAPPVQECPDGFTPDEALGGICARFEPAVQNPPTCPDGSLGQPGGCYILVAKGPRGEPICVEGDLVGDNCIIVGAPPVEGPATCPVSATVILQDGRCFTLVARGVDGTCPVGTTPSPNGVDCERPVDLRPGALMCDADFGLINGQCIRYETPVTPVAECPPGSVEDANGDCRKPVADAAGAYSCPDPAAALNGTSCVYTIGFIFTCDADFGLIDGQCIRYAAPVTPAPQCPAGSVEDANGDCRKPVADGPSDLVCPVGTALDGGVCRASTPAVCTSGQLTNGSCIETTPVVVLCRGQVVTINMRNGDSGIGTSGDDVILGTNGADKIDGRGGNDLICAGGGDDKVRGGTGNDNIYGQGGADNIRGGSGDDNIRGGRGDDTVRGGAGNDDIRGGSGADNLRGGRDTDVLRGGTGDDALRGGAGSGDVCIGNAGTDTAARSCEITASIP